MVYSKQERKVQLIDIAVPGIKNIHITYTEKIRKYQEVAAH